MKWLVTTLYAMALTAAFNGMVLFASHLAAPWSALTWLVGLYTYGLLLHRRLQRAHPDRYTPVTPPANRQHLDRLVSAARPRGTACPDCEAAAANGRPSDGACPPAAGSDPAEGEAAAPTSPDESQPPRVIPGPPPPGVLGTLAGPPGPAVGRNATYRIQILDPSAESLGRTYWINEERMLSALAHLYRTYFSSPRARPRIKIEPSFDLRLANLKARQQRNVTEPPFELPVGLRRYFVGLQA